MHKKKYKCNLEFNTNSVLSVRPFSNFFVQTLFLKKFLCFRFHREAWQPQGKYSYQAGHLKAVPHQNLQAAVHTEIFPDQHLIIYSYRQEMENVCNIV